VLILDGGTIELKFNEQKHDEAELITDEFKTGGYATRFKDFISRGSFNFEKSIYYP
jgi:hypothetical protein